MKPILFNTDMVRAILDGRKTVTRRAVKPQNKILENPEFGYTAFTPKGYISVRGGWEDGEGDKRYGENFIKSPYRPGDILYVRETWNYGYCDKTDFEFQYNETFFEELKPGAYKDSYLMPRYFYRTDDLDGIVGIKWRPSIHMPREAARIFLRVKSVRVERLQDIDDDGIVDEGLEIGAPFEELWDRTIKPEDLALYGWDANPYVWVIEFERISKEEALKHV